MCIIKGLAKIYVSGQVRWNQTPTWSSRVVVKWGTCTHTYQHGWQRPRGIGPGLLLTQMTVYVQTVDALKGDTPKSAPHSACHVPRRMNMGRFSGSDSRLRASCSAAEN